MENIRLVRTQDDLYGLHVADDGNINLHRDAREYNRNTSHFSVNGAVGNHAYGSFDGQIAIIADPREMMVPSGFGQADVWFHHDGNDNLNVGRAVVVAPEGFDLPADVTAIRYDANDPDGRNNAINNHLTSVGVEPKQFGMWGWANESMQAHDEWKIETIIELYGAASPSIQLVPHSASLDDAIDSSVNACEGVLKSARTKYLYDNGEFETPYTQVLDELVVGADTALQSFKKGASSDTVQVAAAFLGRMEEKLDFFKAENRKLKQMYGAPYFLPQADGAKPGVGHSYDEVEQMIKSGRVDRDSLVKDIRSGQSWTPISEAFGDVSWPAQTATQASTPPPLPVGLMPPPLPDASIGAAVAPPPLPNALSGASMMPPPLPLEGQSTAPAAVRSGFPGPPTDPAALEALAKRFLLMMEPVGEKKVMKNSPAPR